MYVHQRLFSVLIAGFFLCMRLPRLAVYVGLPVGVGWHVPLVGVEGRGGYKPAEGEGDEDREKKASASGRGGA